MDRHATSGGTHRYAARFAAATAAGHFRTPAGCATPDEAAPLFSSMGIGTYLGAPDAATDESYADAVIAAVEGGINVIDTAINYRYQRSERSIGAALAELARRGFAREEIVVCTKGGYLTPDAASRPLPAPISRKNTWDRESCARKMLRLDATRCRRLSWQISSTVACEIWASTASTSITFTIRRRN